MKRIFLFSFLFFICVSYSFSNPSKIDSLLTLLKEKGKDSIQVNRLNQLSREYMIAAVYDSALNYANKALDLANYLPPEEGKFGIAVANGNIGGVYYWRGDYLKSRDYFSKAIDLLEQLEQNGKESIKSVKEQKEFMLRSMGSSYFRQGDNAKALEYFFKALKMSEDLEDKSMIATSFGAIGIAYRNQENFPKAIEYNLKALKIKEGLGDKKGIAAFLGSIGTIYDMQSDFKNALDYRGRSLKMAQEIGDQSILAENFGNMGIIYNKQAGESKEEAKDSIYEKARYYFSEALKITEKLENKITTSTWLNSMGTTYYKQSKTEKSEAKRMDLLNKALEYHFKSLKLKKELGNKFNTATQLISIGSVYIDLKKYSEAEKYLQDALKTEVEIGAIQQQMFCETSLSELYEKAGRAQQALEHYKKAMALKDTLFNVENSQKIASIQFSYEQQKKDSVRELEQKAKEQQHSAEIERQRIIALSAIVGLILVIGFAGFIFRSLRITNKQKAIIEEKNKEITDSINYAQRIQRALLASDDLLKKSLGEYFVMFRPKDIVSGDFYWAAEKDGRFYLAVCDSTGHGVPGAFMSLLNISFLNEAINEKGFINPNQVFNHVRQRLIENISSDGAQDGMDGILVCFDKNKKEISYAAAHNAPLLVNNSIEGLDSDNMPVGLGDRKDSFTHQTVSFQSGSMLYLYTDGYADQFGGQKGKKFKRKQLEEKLLAISHTSIAEQQQELEKTFEGWKGNLEQVDDILIIGIKI